MDSHSCPGSAEALQQDVLRVLGTAGAGFHHGKASLEIPEESSNDGIIACQ